MMRTDTHRQGLHPACCVDPDCRLLYVEHLRGFQVSAAATPNRRPVTADTLTRDRKLDADLDAYKRLRHDGIQPPRNEGCAALEARANHRWEVESKPRMEGET